MPEYLKYNINNQYDRIAIKLLVREIISETIVEGLIKTYPLDSVAKFLDGLGYVEDVDYSCDHDDNSFVIRHVVDDNTYSKYNSIVNKLQNTYGWIHGTTQTMYTHNKIKPDSKYLSNKTDFTKKENIGNTYILYFEPKFDIDYNIVNNDRDIVKISI